MHHRCIPSRQTAAERPSPETHPPSLRATTRDALASAQPELAVARGTSSALCGPAGGRCRAGYPRSPRPHPSAQTFGRFADARDPQRQQSHRFHGKKTAMARHHERNWVASKGVACGRRLASADPRGNLKGNARAEATALVCRALAEGLARSSRSNRGDYLVATQRWPPQRIHGRRPSRSCRVTDEPQNFS